ncbi:CBS domain-containing protein [Pseudomonas oryzae]|uniref:CBS domain-containing protein n=1 Tax=Pseudomonas oryzae TaxID=1392877 RepID=A0A1H1W1V2_9PSED|nr:CBS domain-containing protein [Pseudomonas oryzae]SDS91248.1 CBS domain-containing protein [Pseudomonas oryzae]
MRTVAQMLRAKPNQDIYTIAPTATVLEALQLMAEKNIGALIVTEGDQVVGLVSERDYARKMVLRGRSSVGTPVSLIMASPVISVNSTQNTRDCLRLMGRGHLRHLPVIDDGKLVGMLSVGNLVKEVLAEQDEMIQQLEQYIRG